MRSPSAVLAVGLVLLMSLFLTACGDGDLRAAPRARAGVIDLTGWDFAARGPVDLAGEWGVTWGATAAEAIDGRPARFILQPGAWNSGDAPPGLGRASLSLTVLLPAGGPQLALAVPDVNSAYRLYLNGRPELAVGVVGDDADREVPVYQRPVVHVDHGVATLQVVLEMSNHHHAEGGLTGPVVIGGHELLTARAEQRLVVPLAALGALVVVFLLQIVFFAGGRREWAFLIFAAFTVLIAVRTFSSGLVYSLVDPSLRSDVWYLLPVYLSLFVSPGIYLLFLRELFPAETPRRLVVSVVAVSAAAVVAALVLPPAVYTRLGPPFQVLTLAMPVVGAGILGVAVWRRRVGGGWMLAGSVAFLATMVNDTLRDQRIIESELSSLGFAAFAVAYSAALALRLFRSERDASARLTGMARVLEERVAERTASLAEAKAAAEQASQARSDFLAVMSHEIRTPIHGWAGLTDLLAQTPLTAQQRGYVDLLRRTADDLGLLLGDILDMARIESGRMAVERVPFDLARLIDEVAEAGRALARGHGLTFELGMAGGVPVSVLGDRSVVRRVLLAFLDNAAKFTERGDIGLEVAGAGAGTIRFSVSDTGCGIPADRRADLFAAFSPAGASSRRRHGGSGIGLALCRRLAELAGGTVGVDSTPGVGSTFWCELPLPPAAPAPGDDRDDRRRVLPSGTRVLFADDVALNRLVLRAFLAAADDRRMALEAGFDVFLGKPIERDQLLAELAHLLPERPHPLPPPPTPPAGLEHLMPLFVSEMERDARRLDEIKGGDRAELAEFAHAMRGKAAMFGEDALFTLLTRLETQAPDAEDGEISQTVARVVERARQLGVYDPAS